MVPTAARGNLAHIASNTTAQTTTANLVLVTTNVGWVASPTWRPALAAITGKEAPNAKPTAIIRLALRETRHPGIPLVVVCISLSHTGFGQTQSPWWHPAALGLEYPFLCGDWRGPI